MIIWFGVSYAQDTTTSPITWEYAGEAVFPTPQKPEPGWVTLRDGRPSLDDRLRRTRRVDHSGGIWKVLDVDYVALRELSLEQSHDANEDSVWSDPTVATSASRSDELVYWEPQGRNTDTCATDTIHYYDSDGVGSAGIGIPALWFLA